MMNAYANQDETLAVSLQEGINVIRLAVKGATMPAGIKKAVSLKGVDVGNPRFPTKPITSQDHIDLIQEALKYYY